LIASTNARESCSIRTRRRRDFANDRRHLLAVAGQVNVDKAFRDVASWVSGNEKDAMRPVLRGC
jgi:hypothetical protein